MSENSEWDKLAETLAQFPDVVERIVKRHVQPELSAPFYEARAIPLPVGESVQIFVYNAARIRFIARASADNLIQIGDRNQLVENLGWIVGANNPVPMATVAEVYAKASAPATLYIWAEYRKE